MSRRSGPAGRGSRPPSKGHRQRSVSHGGRSRPPINIPLAHAVHAGRDSRGRCLARAARPVPVGCNGLRRRPAGRLARNGVKENRLPTEGVLHKSGTHGRPPPRRRIGPGFEPGPIEIRGVSAGRLQRHLRAILSQNPQAGPRANYLTRPSARQAPRDAAQ